MVEDLAGRAHSTFLEEDGFIEDNRIIGMDVDDSHATSRSVTPGTLFTYMNPAKITEKQHMRIEWLLFRFFICCAIPWAVMDDTFFIDVITCLAPNFSVPDRSSFFTKHLGQEVAAWSQKFKDFISDKTHLTLSFDGWSTRAKDEVYTFHTTTPKRRSFFTDGHVFKGLSVTADALYDIMIGVRGFYLP